MAVRDIHPFGVIAHYREHLPLDPGTAPVTLGEGSTPLIPAAWLSRELGCDVYLKYEAANPTGSFKDRGMTMAITKAAEEGAKAVICASTGNTSASAAAYATKAGLISGVLVPQGKIAMGKLSQALMHGAEVVAIEGNFDLALNYVKEIATRHPITLVNSVNPYRIEGE
jgi:threonine synthase